MSSRKLSPEQREELLTGLKTRFEENMSRHEAIDWAEVQARLEGEDRKVWSLHRMERTGGEPDVVGRNEATGELTFVDCSAESPEGRRGALFCHRRYDTVFLYHNGAQSYYATRGFRGSLRV